MCINEEKVMEKRVEDSFYLTPHAIPHFNKKQTF